MIFAISEILMDYSCWSEMKKNVRLIHVVVQCPQYVVLVLVAASLRPNSKRVFGPNPVFDMP